MYNILWGISGLRSRFAKYVYVLDEVTELKIRMNIKGLTGNIPTLPVRPVEKLDRTIKSDSAHDRDANGQQLFDDQKKQREQMSEEQIEKCIEHLKNLPAVKDNNWIIEFSEIESRRFVLVKDSSGQLIRKFPESDLWTLPTDLDDPKGQLLKKTA